MIVVADATPLIALVKLRRIDLLRAIFGEIYVPDGVYHEVVVQGRQRPGAKEIREANWIHRQTVSDQAMVDLLRGELDRGEAEVLVLAEELKADWVLLDEERARLAARLVGRRRMGTAGVLVLAKRRGLIDNVETLLDELCRQKFRLSDRVYLEALRQAGER